MRLSERQRRLVRSYGLLILIAIAFFLLAMFMHEAPKTVPQKSLGHVTAPLVLEV